MPHPETKPPDRICTEKHPEEKLFGVLVFGLCVYQTEVTIPGWVNG